jgi:threonylcarbamoyladenosine tRNA methylthiotransferase MtaB
MELNGKKVAFHTLGCKLNFSETSTIARDFKDKGFAQVSFDDKAEVYVINTCSVTHNADKECKYWVKKANTANPDALVVVVGCYAQLQPEEIANFEGVDLVLGATEKFKVTDYLDSLTKSDKGEVHTYCTIPLARGISRSDNLENVLKNAREIVAEGAKEIVLTGVNIGDYGKGEFGNKKHEHTFLELVQELDKTEGIDRFRISSIEPNLLKDATIAFVAQSERFVPHFHIPLQSGSNKILQKMKRRYSRELYMERIARINKLMPHAAIGVDVICGFPGESEEDFLETYNFINSLEISYLHVFTYSQRPNTEADEMENQVPYNIRKKRSKMLRVLSAKKRRSFYEAQLNTERSVLFEDNMKEGYITGFTENYVKVKSPWNPHLVNQKAKVKLTNIDEDGFVRFEYLEELPILA